MCDVLLVTLFFLRCLQQRVSAALCVVAFCTHKKEEEHIAPAATTAAATATGRRANRTTKSVLHLLPVEDIKFANFHLTLNNCRTEKCLFFRDCMRIFKERSIDIYKVSE